MRFRNLPTLILGLFLTCALPMSALALEFVSDFVDFESDWLLEEGSEVLQGPDSITLSAAEISPRNRGRILTRPILAATPEEIRGATYILDASEVSAPLAARAFYYDVERNYLGSDPLFGTLEGGRIVAFGTVLNPGSDVAGVRIRIYSNAQEGSVQISRLQITESALPVPEPGTALLMGLGLIGLTSVRRAPRA